MSSTIVRRCVVALVAAATIATVSACGSNDGDAAGDASEDEGSGEDPSDRSVHFFESVDICAVAAEEITALIDPNGTGNVTSEWFDEGLSDDSKTCMWSGDFGNEVSVEIGTYDMFRPMTDVPAEENPQELPGAWDEGWTANTVLGEQMTWRRDEVTFDVDASLNSEGALTPELAEAIDAAVKDAGH